eukprot:2701247-Pleurochrysis_carterae.AAC.1
MPRTCRSLRRAARVVFKARGLDAMRRSMRTLGAGCTDGGPVSSGVMAAGGTKGVGCHSACVFLTSSFARSAGGRGLDEATCVSGLSGSAEATELHVEARWDTCMLRVPSNLASVLYVRKPYASRRPGIDMRPKWRTQNKLALARAHEADRRRPLEIATHA